MRRKASRSKSAFFYAKDLADCCLARLGMKSDHQLLKMHILVRLSNTATMRWNGSVLGCVLTVDSCLCENEGMFFKGLLYGE